MLEPVRWRPARGPRGALTPCALLAAAWASGCIVTDPPGEEVGVFDVQSTLQENTCGQTAVYAGDDSYSVELRSDDTSVYWQALGGQPLVGRLEAPGQLRITLQRAIRLYGPGEREDMQPLNSPLDFAELGPQESTDSRGCTLIQAEELTARFGAALASDAGVLDASTDAMAQADAAPDADGDASAADLVGEHVLKLSASPESDCSAAMQARGGPFVSLPCEIHYELGAVLRP